MRIKIMPCLQRISCGTRFEAP